MELNLTLILKILERFSRFEYMLNEVTSVAYRFKRSWEFRCVYHKKEKGANNHNILDTEARLRRRDNCEIYTLR